MLGMNRTWDIQTEMLLTDDEKANLADHDLMTHARNLMTLIRTANDSLNDLRGVLVQRRDYMDGVLWQINEIGQTNPTLVVTNS